jgi:hypothetical protein
MSEEIVLPPFSSILPGQNIVTPTNCVSIQLNYNATGGSFVISVLSNTLKMPLENAQLTLPYGRVATVKSVARGYSGSGIIDIISGPAVPPLATLLTLVGIPGNTFQYANILAGLLGTGMGQTLSPLVPMLAQSIPVYWKTLSPLVRSFVYRGNVLAGIQQLASYVLGDVIVRSDGVYVVDPGTIIGTTPFSVPKADVVSANQTVDYSQDEASVLNPALSANQLIPQGQFVYDSQHAQKQGKTTVQAGAPGSQGSTDFIPIPDGWQVDGNFEEWTPQSDTDFTNPNSTANNGRYWKVFQSPTDPTMLRGILSFTRLIKQINLGNNNNSSPLQSVQATQGNVSTFVGSPVTGETNPGVGNVFSFDEPGSESGIYGFTANPTTFFDIISNQYLTYPNAIVLVPTGSGVDSGSASTEFFSITMEIWTFPRVNPQVFPTGNPINPFNIPKDAVVVSPPMGNVIFNSINTLQQYWFKYMENYRLIHSPRLRTTLSSVFRGYMPQVGDQLNVQSGLQYKNCGRIQSVTLSLARSGLVLNIVAELYQYGQGLYQKYPAVQQVFPA